MNTTPLILFVTLTNCLAQTPIDTTRTIDIGGIKQFVTIKGKDRSNPLLLFLHGGPGNSVMGYAEKFTGRLQEHFVVVQWDQRETGKTRELNASPLPLTVALFQTDTHELITLLLMESGQPKLFLAGHSWGTVLGFDIAKKYPDLLFAYLAISPVINQPESERILLARMKEQAKRENNEPALEQLSKVKIPFETGEQLYYDRKWLFHFNGQTSAEKSFTKDVAISWSATWLTLWNEASQIILNESLPSIGCPVYFLVGRRDYQTNFGIAEDYFNLLAAPKKKLFWFDTGHSIPASRPAQMQDIIIKEILPQTYH